MAKTKTYAKMNKKDFNEIIESIADHLFEENKIKLLEKMFEWRSSDNKPAITNEPPLDKDLGDLAIIDPKSSIQVSDENMPINDRNWVPANSKDLGKAMRQMADMVPETQIEWFYTKLRRLVDSSIDQEDEMKMRPRLGNEL